MANRAQKKTVILQTVVLANPVFPQFHASWVIQSPSRSFNCAEHSLCCENWQKRQHTRRCTDRGLSFHQGTHQLFFFPHPQTPISTKLSGTEAVTSSTIIRCKSHLKDRSIKVWKGEGCSSLQDLRHYLQMKKNKHFKISFSFHLRP